MYGGIDSFPLLAVPFFILAGNLMNSAGITNRIYNFALALVGWLKGGLGHVNIVGSMIFAGMSGTATAGWYAHRRGYGRDATFSWPALARTFADAFLALMTPVILLGGMTFGVFTPTEGAIVASAYALVLGLAWYRTISLKMLAKISMDTIETTATVL